MVAKTRWECWLRDFGGGMAAALVGVFAALPFSTPNLPQGHDVLFHLYRLVQLDVLWKQGRFFSRWMPDFAYGYGYPLFNYYAPLAYYLVEPLHLLGVSSIASLRLVFALCLVLGALFAYLWIRELVGQAGALVGAAAYVLTPYTLQTALNRGSLTELLALALMPAVLWLFECVLKSPRRWYGVAAALVYAALLLSHNVSALFFTLFLCPYLLVRVWVLYGAPEHRSQIAPALIRVALLVALGLGLSAFFWVPALQERDLVQLHQLYTPAAFDFRANFLQLGQLFAFPVPYDPSQVNCIGPLSLNWVALSLALVAIFHGARTWRQSPAATIGFGALIGGISLFMTLPVSRPVWELVPALRILQFPWRFLGIATLSIAMLAGQGIQVLCTYIFPGGALRAGLPLAVVLALGLYILPWQYADRLPYMEDVFISDYVDIERRNGWIGTTTTGEYLPVTVKERPPENSPTLEQEDACLDVASLPAGGRVLSIECGPTRYRLAVESPEPFQAVFHTFFFPGWQARVADAPAAVRPVGDHGFLGVEVPAGRRQIEVWFGSTPVRSWASGVSIVSVGLLLGISAGGLPFTGKAAPVLPAPGDGLAPSVTRTLLAGLVALTLFKVAYVDWYETIFRRARFDDPCLSGMPCDFRVNFAGRIVLIGVELPAQVQSGESADIMLYWRLARPAGMEYSVSVSLVDARGYVVGQDDNQHPGGYPTTQWSETKYGRDPHEIPIRPGTPPGVYTVRVKVYPYGQPENTFDVLNADAAPVGRETDVGAIEITRPRAPANLDALAPLHRVDAVVTDGLRLLGYDLAANAPYWAGESLPLTLYWQS
ncbi:MAG: glycosyltransferase family 39 protein, partial [Anaerolineae bacterium]|nr:glycosyltransferase family 39 protein [Anaerolineae bacterium]